MEWCNINSANLLHEEKKKALDAYNKVGSIPISDQLSRDFDSSFFCITASQTYLDVEYKKRKHLKLDKFTKTIQFLEDNAANKEAIIKYYLIKTGLTYPSKELTKIRKDLFSRLLKNLHLSSASFLSIVNTKIQNDQVLVYNDLLSLSLIHI